MTYENGRTLKKHLQTFNTIYSILKDNCLLLSFKWWSSNTVTALSPMVFTKEKTKQKWRE